MVVKYFHRSVDLVNSVNKRITSNELIRKKDRVLLSVSGGQDSICLMFLLNHLYAQMELHLALFWCHHLWQFDSFSLMRQIAKLSFLFQLNSYFAISPNFIPSELLARHWRHNSSYRICFFYNYYKISLAHSANDKVETVFLNLIRGTGLAGLFPLRWTQLVSKKRVQNEKHISQFSTFLFSPFFWYTGSLARFCCATSFRLFHQHFNENEPRKELAKFQLAKRRSQPIPSFASPRIATKAKGATKGVWNNCRRLMGSIKKKTSPCYYFQYADLKETDKAFLHRTSITVDMQKICFLFTLLPQCECIAGVRSRITFPLLLLFDMQKSPGPKLVLPSHFLPSNPILCDSSSYLVLPIPWGCFASIPQVGSTVTFAIQRGLPIPRRGLRSWLCSRWVWWLRSTPKICKGVFALPNPKDCFAKPLIRNTLAHPSAASQEQYSSSCSYTLGNRKQEDPYILKTTKAVVLKKKPQQKLKFKNINKKITAKKWFCYVSYTFLKVCL